MQYRTLGSTGLKVSNLCLGTMTFGSNFYGIAVLDEKAAQELVDRAIGAGVNFFDTADVYSYGEAESILGKALGARRKDVVIATKVRGRMGPGPNEAGLSRHHILASADASLRRLGTDYIDLYQIHGWDAATPIEETLEALNDLVRWGKVRYLGFSNVAAWQLAKALWTSDVHGWSRFVSLQPYYSLVGRDVEHELIPLCRDQGIGVLPWSPLAGGFLSGKYRRGQHPPKGTRRAGTVADFPPVDLERGYTILDALDRIAAAHQVSVAQAAIAWLLAQLAVSSVIVGANKLAQLEDNLGAAALTLTAEELHELDKVSRPAEPYPQWMISFQNRE